MRCAQCGLENAEGTVICVACDHILDASFLGEDVLGGAPPLGDDDLTGPPTLASEQTGSFLTAQTSNGLRLIEPEPFATSEAKVLFDRDAVLALVDGVDITTLELTPFESHVVKFIDGQRPVARLRGLAGVGAEDLRICLGMLADRGVLVRVATARAVIDDEKTGQISLEGVPLESFGFENERTDAVLLPEDLLSDDIELVPVVTPLPVNFHAGFADLATAALDFVDEESPMTLEPGASPFAQSASVGASVGRTPPSPAAPQMPVIPSSGGIPPLPVMAPGRAPSGRVPPLSGGVGPVRPVTTGIPPIPGGAAVRAPLTSGEGAAVSGIRPSLRAPGAPPPVAKEAAPVVEPAPAAVPPVSGPIPVRRAPTEAQIKARQAYELALKDIKDNKLSRAFAYARAARELDPDNDLYKELIDNWGRQTGATRAPLGTKR
jgi:hypothetical protein